MPLAMRLSRSRPRPVRPAPPALGGLRRRLLSGAAQARPPLCLLNSLTGAKAPLPLPEDRALTWYSCGPTVYDAAHLGHARNYVCLDIIHRVLTVRAPWPPTSPHLLHPAPSMASDRGRGGRRTTTASRC